MLGVYFLVLVLGTILAKADVASHAEIVRRDPAYHIKFPKLYFPGETVDPIPSGHNEEIGMQSPPIGQIPEYFEAPTPRKLWDEHVKLYRPAVYRGLLNGSPAIDKWTSDDYLAKEYGDQEVLVERKTEDRKTEPKRMTIAGFLEQYKLHNWYVVTILPNAMRKDLKVPKPLKCSTFRKNLQELNLWIGTHGTRSVLHYDADNILHCVVSGRKDWILIHPDNKPNVDMVLSNRGQGSGFSHLYVDGINMAENPQLTQLPWEYVTLYGGDCLYLPPQYLHQVRSYNRSVSATYLFYPRDSFNDDDCKDVDLEKYMSLDDVFVYWVYEKGQETVDMGYQNPVNIRKEVLASFASTGIKSFTWNEFLYCLYATKGEEIITRGKVIKKFFMDIDANNDGQASIEEMTSLRLEDWKDYCRNTDDPHGPTKSEMGINPEKTNASAAFNPRLNDYYSDIRNAKLFLKKILKKHGKNNKLIYPEFKKLVRVVDGDITSAFLLLDGNMNGVLTLDEVENISDPSMRKVSRMGYAYTLNEELHGGGLYEDEDILEGESGEMDSGEIFPEQFQFVEDALKKGLKMVKKSSSQKMNQEEFKKLFGNSRETSTLDLDFIFKYMSASSEYITPENFNQILHWEKPMQDGEESEDEDAPLVKKDRSAEDTPRLANKRHGLAQLLEAMTTIEEFKKEIKQRKQKEGQTKRDEL